MTNAPEHFIRNGGAPCEAPRLYRGCGLDNIYLCNGFQVEEIDGEEYVHVEDVEGLHCAIALHLVSNRKVFAGKEIKFIRKAMDLTQSELARRIGSTSQSVARWEKEQTEIPGAADLMIRVNFLVSLLDAQEFADLIKELPLRLEQMDEARNERAQFCHQERWLEAA